MIHGLITIADPLRSNIKQIIQQLNGTHIKNTIMLTGDNKGTAQKSHNFQVLKKFMLN